MRGILIAVGIMVLSGRELSLISVGAFLTIAGYSINDTIVVFDRIREGLRTKRGNVEGIMNLSLNQTLRRLPSVCNGDTVIDDEFNPCLEYEFYSVDTFDGLGDHFSDCASVSTGHDTWNEVKALYR